MLVVYLTRTFTNGRQETEEIHMDEEEIREISKNPNEIAAYKAMADKWESEHVLDACSVSWDVELK